MRPRDPFPIDVRRTVGIRDVGPMGRRRRPVVTFGRLAAVCALLVVLSLALALPPPV